MQKWSLQPHDRLQVNGGVEILGRMYAANETFRGQVRPEKLQQRTAEVPTCTYILLASHS